jgi:hypothetical protein
VPLLRTIRAESIAVPRTTTVMKIRRINKGKLKAQKAKTDKADERKWMADETKRYLKGLGNRWFNKR